MSDNNNIHVRAEFTIEEEKRGIQGAHTGNEQNG
jgi:hypothetical protein